MKVGEATQSSDAIPHVGREGSRRMSKSIGGGELGSDPMMEKGDRRNNFLSE